MTNNSGMQGIRGNDANSPTGRDWRDDLYCQRHQDDRKKIPQSPPHRSFHPFRTVSANHAKSPVSRLDHWVMSALPPCLYNRGTKFIPRYEMRRVLSMGPAKFMFPALCPPKPNRMRLMQLGGEIAI